MSTKSTAIFDEKHKEAVNDCEETLFAVIRVDTHGNRDTVQQKVSKIEALKTEAYYDAMTHHQGYYVVEQKFVDAELRKPS